MGLSYGENFIINCFSDRTNCRIYVASVVVCRLWHYVLWLNGAPESRSYYWQLIGSAIWEIDWYQNKWPWPLFRGRIKVKSTIASHSPLNISETVRDRGLIPKDHRQEMACRELNGHVIDDVAWPWKSQTRDPNTLKSHYVENSWRCYLATIANY